MARAAPSHPNGSAPYTGTRWTRLTCRVNRHRHSGSGARTSTAWPAVDRRVAHWREVSPEPSLSSTFICVYQTLAIHGGASGTAISEVSGQATADQAGAGARGGPGTAH